MGIENQENSAPLEKAPSQIADIAPIQESRNTMIRTREQLRELVETPLLSACEELYDKNIRTLSTSANEQDIRYGSAHFVIDFDSLSDENKKIGEQLGKVHHADNMNQLSIGIPVVADSTVREIKEFADSIAHKFQHQPMTWAPKYTLEEMRQIHGLDPHDETHGVEFFEGLFFYDTGRKLFYHSEEHARKAREGDRG